MKSSSSRSAEFSRRDFVRVIGSAAVATAAAPLAVGSMLDDVGPTKTSVSETAVKHLYDSLSEKQTGTICMPFEHELRSKINANWGITDPEIGSDFYTDDQRHLISEIVKGATSEDGYERLLKQMDDDNGGIDQYSCAIFGKPGTDQFEFELTGRHLTIRADGNSVANAAFGGPIVYGHGEEDPKQNLFYYQTEAVNKVFQALDPKHRDVALLKKAPQENAVQLQGESGKFPGLAAGELSSDQIELFESVLKTLLAPYREEDVNEALTLLKKGGGLESLHMAFYEAGDLNNDKVWDIWRVEGPSFVWHFRGAPHVHAYINIGIKA